MEKQLLTDNRPEIETRYYDTAEDPTLSAEVDPALGFSCQDVETAMLGSFVGTYTPVEGEAFAVDIAIGIDGIVAVQDHVERPSTWTATLMFAMSSEQRDGGYRIDDLWAPNLTVEQLTAAELSGTKPAADFGGTIPATGDPRIEATFGPNGWTGSLFFGDTRHGTFLLSR